MHTAHIHKTTTCHSEDAILDKIEGRTENCIVSKERAGQLDT